MPSVAVIGLGRMGSAAARRLASKGFRLVLWSRSLDKARRIAEELGGEAADSPRQAAESVDAVHVFVSDDPALLSVALGPAGLLEASARMYNHTTCSVHASKLLDEESAKRGGVYVEAPILAGPSKVESGDALVICGAREESLCRAPSLEALGDVVYVGRPPAAMAAKLAANHLFLSIVSALGDAMALAEAYGVAAERFLEEVIGRTWMRVITERYGGRLWPGHPASFAARLAGKDARYAADALASAGLSPSLAAAVAEHYAAMVREGLGEEDYPAVAGFMARLASKRGRP